MAAQTRKTNEVARQNTPIMIIDLGQIQLANTAAEAANKDAKKPRNTIVARVLYFDLTLVF